MLLLEGHKNGRQRREQSTPCASFTINLRRDDDGILKLMQSFFQCGKIVYGKTRNMCNLRFRTMVELAIVVKHFDNFSLLAKKKRDYSIWREGVTLLLRVAERKQIRSRGYSSYKWSLEEFAEFMVIKEELQAIRKFVE